MAKKKGLLDVPLETRAIIFRHVFADSKTRLIGFGNGIPVTIVGGHFHRVLLTCRGLYKEGRPIFAACTTLVFELSLPGELPDSFQSYYYPLVQNIEVEFHPRQKNFNTDAFSSLQNLTLRHVTIWSGTQSYIINILPNQQASVDILHGVMDQRLKIRAREIYIRSSNWIEKALSDESRAFVIFDSVRAQWAGPFGDQGHVSLKFNLDTLKTEERVAETIFLGAAKQELNEAETFFDAMAVSGYHPYRGVTLSGIGPWSRSLDGVAI